MSDFLQLLVTHPAYDYLCIFFPPHSHFGALLTRILESVKIFLLWLNSVNCILHFGRDPIISFAGLVLSSFGSFASMFVFLAHLHLSGQHVVSAVSLVSPAAKKDKVMTRFYSWWQWYKEWKSGCTKKVASKKSWQDFSAENCDHCPSVDLS